MSSDKLKFKVGDRLKFVRKWGNIAPEHEQYFNKYGTIVKADDSGFYVKMDGMTSIKKHDLWYWLPQSLDRYYDRAGKQLFLF